MAPVWPELPDRGPILDSPRSALIEAMATLADERVGGADLFATLTWDDSRKPHWSGYDRVGLGTALRDVGRYVQDLAEVYPGIGAFFAFEEHQDGRPHAHGLVGGLPVGVAAAVDAGRTHAAAAPAGATRPLEDRQARSEFWGRWYDEHGIARVEGVRDGQAAAGYAAKYCFKELGPWRLWLPGEARLAWQGRHRTARRWR